MRQQQQLEKEIVGRKRELTVLSSVAAALSQSPELGDMLQGALDAVLEALEMEAGAIYLLDEKRYELTFKTGRGVPTGAQEHSPDSDLWARCGIRVVQSGNAEIMDDTSDEPESMREEAREAGSETIVGVPLRAKGVTLGVMEFATSQPRPFEEDDLQLLATIGSQIGAAIQNATLVEQVERRLRDLNRLYRVATDIVSTLDLDQVLRSIVDTAQEVIPTADKAMIHLLDEETGLLVPRIPSDPELDPLRRARMFVGEGIAGLVSQKKKGTYVPDTREDPRYVDLGSDLRSLLVVPLLVEEKVIGTLTVDSTGVDAFDRENQRMLTMLASQAAIAITNARLHQRIRTSEERYRSMVQNASDAICLVDLDTWRFLEANPQAERLSGYTLDELMTMTASDVHYARDGMREQRTFQELLASGETSLENLNVVRTDGRMVPVSMRISPIPYSQATVAQVIIRDVSARKKMEQQLIHTEKLAALGRLAASLAHEINNPLQAIRSSIGLLSKLQVDDYKGEQYLDIAKREVERLIELMQRTVDFYRPSSERRSLVDVSALLEDTLALSSKQLQQSNVEIIKDLSADLPPIRAVGSYLRQVFINIILNSVEAMPHGGELRVSTKTDDQGNHLVIAFGDTGVGIPADQLPYVFEPFHTTKEKGTGLGLAISYSIVEQHEGTVEVDSEDGKGTTFTVRLPLRGEGSV